MSGRQGKFIQRVQGKAGKLLLENEKPTTIRRRLVVAAQALGINLVIKRSGDDLYFWIEGAAEAQPRGRRRYTRRSGSQEETSEPNQPLIEPEFPGSDNSSERVARIEPEN
jgi:hypothetical protein